MAGDPLGGGCVLRWPSHPVATIRDGRDPRARVRVGISPRQVSVACHQHRRSTAAGGSAKSIIRQTTGGPEGLGPRTPARPHRLLRRSHSDWTRFHGRGRKMQPTRNRLTARVCGRPSVARPMGRSGANPIPLDPFATLPPLERRRLAQVLSEAIEETHRTMNRMRCPSPFSTSSSEATEPIPGT